MTTFTSSDTKAEALATLNSNFTEVEDKLTGASPVDLDADQIDVSTFQIGGVTVTATAAQMNQLGSILSRLDVLEGGTPTVATPTFSPVAGSYGSTQSVTIACSTSGAAIHYTTDGSTPTSGSTLYTGAISVAATETIKAIGVKSSYTNSGAASATYTISGGGGGLTSSTTLGNTGGGDDRLVGLNTNYIYTATWFTAAESATILKAAIKLRKAGTPTFSMKAGIWTYDSGTGTPGTLIGSESDVVAAATAVGSSYALVDFVNMSAALTNGTDYCLVIRVTTSTDGATACQWDMGGITTQSHDTEWRSPDGSTWTAQDIANLTQGVATLYK